MRRFVWALVLVTATALVLTFYRPQEHTQSQRGEFVLASNLPESLVDDLVQEFENRTGIWVEVRYGTAQETIALAQAGECDLLLGPCVDTMEYHRDLFRPAAYHAELTNGIPRGGNWVPISFSNLTLIYNSHLIQKNAPTAFEDLLEPQWRGQIAIADPTSCDLAMSILSVLGGEDQSAIPQRLERFAANVSVMLPITRDGVDAVARGDVSMAVVTEDMLYRHISGIVSVVHPKEGRFQFFNGAAIPISSQNPEAAQKMIDFLLEADVQSYILDTFGTQSVLAGLTAESAISDTFNSRRAGQQQWLVLNAWESIWEDENEAVD